MEMATVVSSGSESLPAPKDLTKGDVNYQTEALQLCMLVWKAGRLVE